MTTYKTGKADYNALCDVCGFKFKASQLTKRWDGFMVCAEDYEQRNILDFYRTRQDAFPLPFTRPDDAGELTWTPGVSGVTGSYTLSATYIVDVNNVLTYKILIFPTDDGSGGNSTVTGTNPTFDLPIAVSVDKKGTAIQSNGKYLGQVTNSAAIHVPSFSITRLPLVSLMIAGQYTKA